MDPLHRLGPRFGSDHHAVVVLPSAAWLQKEDELQPLRSLLARLSASAASYSEAVLQRLGEQGWKETLQSLWRKTIGGFYTEKSKGARTEVLKFLKLRAQAWLQWGRAA